MKAGSTQALIVIYGMGYRNGRAKLLTTGHSLCTVCFLHCWILYLKYILSLTKIKNPPMVLDLQ